MILFTIKQKMMNKFYLILLSLIILILVNCNKADEPNPTVEKDYRSDFAGDFKFTIRVTFWWLDLSMGHTVESTSTKYTNGIINLFQNDKLIIKYDTGRITGIYRRDTIGCDLKMTYIKDTLCNEPVINFEGYVFWGYYKTWVSPIFNNDSTLEIQCIPSYEFGGYYINCDSLYFHYSSGGQGAGSYTDIYGIRY